MQRWTLAGLMFGGLLVFNAAPSRSRLEAFGMGVAVAGLVAQVARDLDQNRGDHAAERDRATIAALEAACRLAASRCKSCGGTGEERTAATTTYRRCPDCLPYREALAVPAERSTP